MADTVLELAQEVAELEGQRRLCRWSRYRRRDKPRVNHVLALRAIRMALAKAEARLARAMAKGAER